jgi:hypothetical protein
MSDESPRDLRMASGVRGVVIAVLLIGYGYVMHQPTVSFAASFLIAAAMQIAVIVARRVLPRGQWAMAQYVLEFIADGATVFLFALGVYGGILQTAYNI